jgi:hypothetical protein
MVFTPLTGVMGHSSVLEQLSVMQVKLSVATLRQSPTAGSPESIDQVEVSAALYAQSVV